MALIKAGVWHTTVWCSQLWHEDLWLEYGTAVPAAVVQTFGTSRRRKRRPKFFVLDNEIMLLFAEYLQVKVNRDEIQN